MPPLQLPVINGPWRNSHGEKFLQHSHESVFICWLERFPFSKFYCQKAHPGDFLGRTLLMTLAPWVCRILIALILLYLMFIFLPAPKPPPAILSASTLWGSSWSSPSLFQEVPNPLGSNPKSCSPPTPTSVSFPDPPGWCQVGGGGAQFSAFLQLSKLQFMSFNPHERAPN